MNLNAHPNPATCHRHWTRRGVQSVAVRGGIRASLWLKTAKFRSRLGTCRQTGVGLTQINSASVLVLRQTVKWGFCGLLGEPGVPLGGVTH